MSGISAQKGVESEGVDLFGAPLSQIRDRWGRRSYAKTEENQRLVALLRADGWTHARIANYIGCSEPTLRKHFFRELQQGADMIEADLLAVLMQKARTGSVTAIEKLLSRLDTAKAFNNLRQPQDRKPERLGKKERLDLEARKPTDSWAERLQ